MNNLSRIFTYYSLVLFNFFPVSGQVGNIELRHINVDYPDSLVNTSVLTMVHTWKTDPRYTYFWYADGKINQNQGGFSGLLLHGKYEVFGNDQKLIRQGHFNHGLRIGEWMSWYPNGKAKTMVSFKKGMISGALKNFNPDGTLLSVLSYKKGQMDGKSCFYENGKMITRNYRRGKEITKVSLVRHLFRKKKKAPIKDAKDQADQKKNKTEKKAHKCKIFALFHHDPSDKKADETHN